MAEGKHEARELNVRTSLSWLELFRGFQIAIDPRKLLLAAAGILAMALGWWVLSAIFSAITPEPKWSDYDAKYDDHGKAFAKYKADLVDWNVRHKAAGAPDSDAVYGAGDYADNYDDFDDIRLYLKKEPLEHAKGVEAMQRIATRAEGVKREYRKPTGEMRTLPWFENRGPNPYLLVTGQTSVRPTEPGSVLDWLLTQESLVLLEPLIKFLKPIAYFLDNQAGFVTKFYFLLMVVWTLAVWSLFGGAITRMAAVEIARREKVGMVDAVKFAYRRWVSYFSAPVFPLIFVAFLVLLMILFGIFHLVPGLGELVNGALWILALILGLLMAIVLIGLVGWPMMSATVSAEGTDSWEAVSRSYSYIFQAPWHYLWYAILAVLYGAVLVFFVGLVGSMTVYLSRWAFAQVPFSEMENREPSFLFVYSPTSFGWRSLLLTGGHADNERLVNNGVINQSAYDNYVQSMHWNNYLGAYLVSFWIYLFFLMIVGFGYSYFWVASTITYFLMRKKVDDAELDEVYLEEEEHESFFAPPKPPEAGGAKPGPQMVDAPSLRVAPPPPSISTPTVGGPPVPPTMPPPAGPLGGPEPNTSVPPPPTTPPGGDGNPTNN